MVPRSAPLPPYAPGPILQRKYRGATELSVSNVSRKKGEMITKSVELNCFAVAVSSFRVRRSIPNPLVCRRLPMHGGVSCVSVISPGWSSDHVGEGARSMRT